MNIGMLQSLSFLIVIAVDYAKEVAMVEYKNEKALPSIRTWTKAKIAKMGYDIAESFLYFLDKYAIVMVGGARAMAKYYKNNCRKTLLDRLTPSDIAYSILIYESAYEVWTKEILKHETCTTIEEKKSFKNTRHLNSFV